MRSLKTTKSRRVKVKSGSDARHRETDEGSATMVPSHNQKPEKEILFEDYLRPNRFIPNWLFPYLPNEPRIRDYVFLGMGGVVSIVITVALHWIGINDIVSFALPMAGLAILEGDLEVRYMVAGARFARAKKLAREFNS